MHVCKMDHWMKISLLAACMLCITFSDVQMLPNNYILRSYPESPIDGKLWTLSCTEEHGYDIIAAQWFRNSQQIFQTSDSNKTCLLDQSVNSTEYLSVSTRIIKINTSTTQHNVTLRINSTLDNTTVWKCQTGQDSSNNITVFVIDEDTRNNEQTTLGGPIDSTTSNGDGTEVSIFFEDPQNIYIVAGAGSGFVLIIVILIVIVCVWKKRRKQVHKDNPAKEETNAYNSNNSNDGEAAKEDLVMEDNILYGAYIDDANADGIEKRNPQPPLGVSTDEARKFTDVYAQVNKIRKQKNGSQFLTSDP